MSDRVQGLSGRAVRVLALLVAVSLVAGCDRRGGKIPYDPANFTAPDRADYGTEAYDIPLGPLDVLKISFFRVDDLTGEYQVDPFGNIDLPLVGTVSVRGQNPEEFAVNLEKLYGEKYLNNPDISVRVAITNRNMVTVEGGVGQAGIYPLPGRTTLLGALALARGLNSIEANARRVVIFRKRGGETYAAAFDLVAIRHGEMADPVVYPGDTVVVDSSNTRSIFRELMTAVPLIAVFARL